MGGYRSQVVHQCDRQPVLVSGEHAAGWVRLPGDGLADADSDGYVPTDICHINLVVSET